LGREADQHGWTVIECFPTASWTRLGGQRIGLSRARWSRQLLMSLGLENLPSRMNQDARDAIVAARTGQLYGAGAADESFAPIIVPLARPRFD
jgi:predicted nuclease with RNAse H fold